LQNFADFSAYSLAAVRCRDVVGFLLFGNGRKRQDIPSLVLLNVSNEIVGM
jgi:hypothetical protein